MALQEVILSACGLDSTPGAGPSRPNANLTPAIQIHDLMTSTPLQSYKTSTSALHSLGYVASSHGRGGTVMAVQEGKALLNVWAWQKDQMHLKLHLPEKLSCFVVSPNGCWAAGGTVNGHVYLWELASGLLLASFSAHYRTVVSLEFSADSHVLLSSSLDSAVHVYLVSRLVQEDDLGKPYGSLRDHTLAIRDVAIGRTAGVHGGRCWTASEDGTVKMWSLHPPFDLLCTFSLPASATPSALCVDPSERFCYAGTAQGEVVLVPLFKRRDELGQLEAVGGGGIGSAPIKTDGTVISVKSPITTLALSLTGTHLLVGTQAGEVHMYALPSHQHLRTISLAGPVSFLRTMTRPPDMVGVPHKAEQWPVMEIKALERVKSKVTRDNQEVTILLRPSNLDAIAALRPADEEDELLPVGTVPAGEADRIAALEEENKRLRASLDKAVRINDKMWAGIVDMKMLEQGSSGGK